MAPLVLIEGRRRDNLAFTIGSYQVCEKWLKDSQAKGGNNPRAGHVLTNEDIDHYQMIVVALSETIRIMGEIDDVIDQYGGWPSAFRSETISPSSGETSRERFLQKVAEDEASYDETIK